MRTLVFGAKGQLGREIAALFLYEGSVLAVDLPEVDIAETSAVEHITDSYRPDLVINAAAFTDVEGAEDRQEEAFRVNETGARNVAQAAKKTGAMVVFYSTDFVFDGLSNTPYDETAPTSPVNIYGQSKCAGEQAVVEAHPDGHLILRTAWLYGPGGNNFVEKMVHAAQVRPELRVVVDEVGSPTHTEDLALCTQALWHSGERGLFHVVNGGACSRFKQARTALTLAGITTPIYPCHAADIPTKAKRPAYSVLSATKLETVLEKPVRPWREAMERYFKRRASLCSSV